MKKRRKNAYFTVEAALVVPIVLWVIIQTMHIGFYQYNRCLLEQDMGALALKGCTLQVERAEELKEMLSDYAQGIDKNRYIAWEWSEPEIEIGVHQVCVRGGGGQQNAFRRWAGMNARWDSVVRAEYKNHRVNPVKVIRLCRKLMGGE